MRRVRSSTFAPLSEMDTDDDEDQSGGVQFGSNLGNGDLSVSGEKRKQRSVPKRRIRTHVRSASSSGSGGYIPPASVPTPTGLGPGQSPIGSAGYLSGLSSPYSFDDGRPRDLLTAYRTVLKEVHRLNREMHHLRKEVRGYAEESSLWTLRYSRRIVSLSNISLALYILGKRIVEVFNNNSRSMLMLMINPMLWIKRPLFWDWIVSRLGAKKGGAGASVVNGSGAMMGDMHTRSHIPGQIIAGRGIDHAGSVRGRMAHALRDRSSMFKSSWTKTLYQRYYGNKGRRAGGMLDVRHVKAPLGRHHHHQHHHHGHHLHHAHSAKINGGEIQFMLLRLMWRAVTRAILLLFSSYYLGKREVWKRNLGLMVSILSNVHMAFTGEISAWAIYFNMFITLLYITARYYKKIPAAIDTVSERTRRGLSRTMSMQNLARFSPISGSSSGGGGGGDRRSNVPSREENQSDE